MRPLTGPLHICLNAYFSGQKFAFFLAGDQEEPEGGIMRTRSSRLFTVLLALLLFGAAEAYAQTATVVTNSGQRIRGQIVSMGQDNNFGNYDNAYGDSVVVRTNGRDRQIPIQDVTVIDFAGNGNVS